MKASFFILAMGVLIGTAGVLIGLIATKGTLPPPPSENATYTLSEVRTHSTEVDCWTIISGKVYDITSYIPRHPGGQEILQACGNDATALFKTRIDRNGQPVGTGTPHSETAVQILSEYEVGTLKAN